MNERAPHRRQALGLAAAAGVVLVLAASCRPPVRSERALALGLAVFDKSEQGLSVPGRATAGFLVRDGERWRHGRRQGSRSNVFHKLLEYCPAPGRCGLLSLGGSAAALELWQPDGSSEVVWQAEFGGRFSRLRNAEVADVLGDGSAAIVVATHDQGVVALVRPGARGYTVTELDRQPETFVHEIEIGDLDVDGVLEVYATPSQPNALDGRAQRGTVVRYVPARGEGRHVVAVEAVSGGQVEVRRYLADTPASAGQTVAVLPDQLCRCLTAGDVEGDGRRELVATLHKGGIWLLRPQPEGAWERRPSATTR